VLRVRLRHTYCLTFQIPSCTAQDNRPPLPLTFSFFELVILPDHIRSACTNIIPQNIRPTKSSGKGIGCSVSLVRTQTCISSCTHCLFHRGVCRTLLHDRATNHLFNACIAACTLHRSGLDAIDPKRARERESNEGPVYIVVRKQRSRFDLAAVDFLSIHPSVVFPVV
jgi:hypothetical protein